MSNALMRLDSICSHHSPCVATIGFFDGVHRGHRFLIGQVRREAAWRGMESAVVTFPVHPRKVLQPGFCPRLLTTRDEKLDLLAQLDIDRCILFDFTPHLASLSACEFMEVLRNRYNIHTLVVGYDHRFGHNRSEGFDDYVRHAADLGMEVLPAEACSAPGGRPVSSSLIRRLLQDEGDVAQAADCLGYRYFLCGTVVGGRGIGHTLGFPTANLQPDSPDKLIPANGVYAVQVDIDGHSYGGMLNIGVRPTLDNGADRSIEVYIFDFNEDVYGRSMRLSFICRMRGECKFASLDELKAQLLKDEVAVRQTLQAADVLH